MKDWAAFNYEVCECQVGFCAMWQGFLPPSYGAWNNTFVFDLFVNYLKSQFTSGTWLDTFDRKSNIVLSSHCWNMDLSFCSSTTLLSVCNFWKTELHLRSFCGCRVQFSCDCQDFLTPSRAHEKTHPSVKFLADSLWMHEEDFFSNIDSYTNFAFSVHRSWLFLSCLTEIYCLSRSWKTRT